MAKEKTEAARREAAQTTPVERIKRKHATEDLSSKPKLPRNVQSQTIQDCRPVATAVKAAAKPPSTKEEVVEEPPLATPRTAKVVAECLGRSSTSELAVPQEACKRKATSDPAPPEPPAVQEPENDADESSEEDEEDRFKRENITKAKRDIHALLTFFEEYLTS